MRGLIECSAGQVEPNGEEGGVQVSFLKPMKREMLHGNPNVSEDPPFWTTMVDSIGGSLKQDAKGGKRNSRSWGKGGGGQREEEGEDEGEDEGGGGGGGNWRIEMKGRRGRGRGGRRKGGTNERGGGRGSLALMLFSFHGRDGGLSPSALVSLGLPAALGS